MRSDAWKGLEKDIIGCERCPRLRAYCAQIARNKRRSFQNETYWGRPVPGFGDVANARIWIIGLAPAAHGGNRTGRIFTGDRSGDWLFRALYRAGLANQPLSYSRKDGLTLRNVFVSAIIRCAPPDNKPLHVEIENCREYLNRELEFLRPRLRVILALGRVAFYNIWPLICQKKRVKPGFIHGNVLSLGAVSIIQSYHPSQQNTFTGKLTEAMFDSVCKKARALSTFQKNSSHS